MIKLKTATLYETSAMVGSIVGGGGRGDTEKLGSFGLNIGLAFQIKDDILGLVGDRKILKKSVGDDIRQGKKTLLLIHALHKANPSQRRQMLKPLGDPNAAPEDIARAVDVIRSLGAIDHAERKASELIQEAKRSLAPFPPSDAKRSLLSLADFVLVRGY